MGKYDGPLARVVAIAVEEVPPEDWRDFFLAAELMAEESLENRVRLEDAAKRINKAWGGSRTSENVSSLAKQGYLTVASDEKGAYIKAGELGRFIARSQSWLE